MFPEHVTSALLEVIPTCFVKLEPIRCCAIKQRDLCTGPKPCPHLSEDRAAEFPCSNHSPLDALSPADSMRDCFSNSMQAWELSEKSLEGGGFYHQPNTPAWYGLV